MASSPVTKKTDAIARSRAYLTVNIFEALIGFLGVVSAISWAISPSIFQNSAIHEAFGNWAYLWLGIYAISGLMILWGIFRVNMKSEAAGLVLFGAGTIINAIALMAAFGMAAGVSLATLFAAAATCFVRARALTNTKKQTIIVLEEKA